MKNNLHGIGDILRAINSPAIQVDEILTLIMEDVSNLIDAEAWSLLLVDRERNQLVFKKVIGEKSDELTGKRMPIKKGIVGWVVENRKPVIVSDPYRDERFFKNIDKKTGFTTKNILAIPLMSKGKILGVIEAINRVGESEFTENDREVVTNYAEHAAIALENANLVESLQQKVKHLSLISDINKSITSILDLDDLLTRSAELIQKSFNYYYTSIALIEDETAVLKGFSSESNIKPSCKRIKKGSGLIGSVMEGEKTILCADTTEEERYIKGIENIKSEMVIPIKEGGKLVGIIDIGEIEKFAFSREEKDIIEEVSYQLSVAIRNARLYEEIKIATITDDLTGLYNARYCNEKLPELVDEWIGNGLSGALIFMDIDHFKNINDTYNHLIGSKVLHLVGERIMEVTGDDTINIRYGGDEYIIALKDVNLKEAINYTVELQKSITEKIYRIKTEEKDIEITINESFGIADFPGTSSDFNELLRLADLAMYHVKAHGRDNIAFVDPDGKFQLIDK